MSPKRRRDARKSPVLNALMVLSEGKPLTAEQEQLARLRTSEFLRRTRVGYVVVDRVSTPHALEAFAVDALGLTLLTTEGPLALYVPRVPSPPAR
jgi:hypothetical protein